MRDFLGNDLNVGDEIVCIEKEYKNLMTARITRLTEKTIFAVPVKASAWSCQHDAKNNISRKFFPDQVVLHNACVEK